MFRLDQALGQARGNNFDHFGIATFTWHAVTTAGTPASPGPSGPRLLIPERITRLLTRPGRAIPPGRQAALPGNTACGAAGAR